MSDIQLNLRPNLLNKSQRAITAVKHLPISFNQFLYSTSPNGSCLVILLTPTLLILSTYVIVRFKLYFDELGIATIAQTFYAGGSNSNSLINGDVANPYFNYTFDVSALLATGGTYTLRFASIVNEDQM